MQVGWSILLIIHGILAVFLLGAITHQAVGAAWPVTKRGSGFFSSVRGVNGMSYTNAVIVLFLVTFTLGCIIYPTYRINVRTVLHEYRGDDCLRDGFRCAVTNANTQEFLTIANC
jgi:predicted membrane protein